MTENSSIQPEMKVEQQIVKMQEQEKSVNQVLSTADKMKDFTETNMVSTPINEVVAPKRASKFFDK